ncbi:MAG: alpha-glucosidase C-terminal domain-containing protein [Deltaproteobacteria bacterium]|nr:alpha-glucosidase C-terminal domain-containing protein [Deltaproteobacteria bacterium]
MIKTRRKQPAFHPNADFEILGIDPQVFAIARHAENQKLYAVTNISSKRVTASLSSAGAPERMRDVMTGEIFRTDVLKLNPYQFLWLSTMKS